MPPQFRWQQKLESYRCSSSVHTTKPFDDSETDGLRGSGACGKEHPITTPAMSRFLYAYVCVHVTCPHGCKRSEREMCINK
ncbi:hypothetical protein PVAP13_3KG068500 [Panicum virgatum]|uniref:Uncharacterized protein n=1 Tax=Panicum virgatum TaxID=38727 RepID=A0A8T0UN16_PANVG|nr:hypothetical protein PVAP13_3KG068500 [Panicum virgatum]